MTAVRALIVDDEPLAREGIRQLLAKYPGIEIAGEAKDGVHAIELIQSAKPDIVFLDIQMPGLDGFGVVREVGPQKMPVVVFVTAFDEFALQAFEIHAIDYLLKPIDPERFKEAVGHALAQVGLRDTTSVQQKLLDLIEGMTPGRQYLQRVALKSSGKVSFVNTHDVDWIQANGDYIWIYSKGKKNLVREKIGELHTKLDPQHFARIHRSTIVNINCIKDLEPQFYGDYVVNLHDGTKLTLSRSYREKLFSLMNLAG
ncbi:MAG: LytTR family DNA-binding domain-containing protein [bacterium]